MLFSLTPLSSRRIVLLLTVLLAATGLAAVALGAAGAAHHTFLSPSGCGASCYGQPNFWLGHLNPA